MKSRLHKLLINPKEFILKAKSFIQTAIPKNTIPNLFELESKIEDFLQENRDLFYDFDKNYQYLEEKMLLLVLYNY